MFRSEEDDHDRRKVHKARMECDVQYVSNSYGVFRENGGGNKPVPDFLKENSMRKISLVFSFVLIACILQTTCVVESENAARGTSIKNSISNSTPKQRGKIAQFSAGSHGEHEEQNERPERLGRRSRRMKR